MSIKFKPEDKVMCIDANQGSSLKLGEFYTVKNHASSNGMLALAELPGYLYKANRFKPFTGGFEYQVINEWGYHTFYRKLAAEAYINRYGGKIKRRLISDWEDCPYTPEPVKEYRIVDEKNSSWCTNTSLEGIEETRRNLSRHWPMKEFSIESRDIGNWSKL